MQSMNFLFNARTEYYIKKLAPKTVNIVNYNLSPVFSGESLLHINLHHGYV